MVTSIPLIASFGYRNIDLNFCELMNPVHHIDDDYIRVLKKYKQVHGLYYNQSHVPYTADYPSLSHAEKLKLDDLIRKAFIHSAELGVDTVVIHPIKGSIEDNITYLKRCLEELPAPCRLAVENMEREDEISTAEELIEITDALGERAGICLDTGHAHMRGLSIPDMIRKMDKRLIATHIADNHGSSDEHFMPYFGTIPWEDVTAALNDIDYQGYMTYEIMFFMRYVPASLQEDVGRLSYRVLTHLISQTNSSF
ncbi:MAG: sugar phosphate isomerase/epimerase family protein [Bullifex sp.]